MGVASRTSAGRSLNIRRVLTTAALFAMAAAFAGTCAAQPAAVTLNIQLDKPLHAVSPTLYGLMTEEINYSYDGGLYRGDGAQPNFPGSWIRRSCTLEY